MKQESNIPGGLSKPAQRALAGAGIDSLEKLAKKSEAEVARLHGIGPHALVRLKEALKAKGLMYAQS